MGPWSVRQPCMVMAIHEFHVRIIIQYIPSAAKLMQLDSNKTFPALLSEKQWLSCGQTLLLWGSRKPERNKGLGEGEGVQCSNGIE